MTSRDLIFAIAVAIYLVSVGGLGLVIARSSRAAPDGDQGFSDEMIAKLRGADRP